MRDTERTPRRRTLLLTLIAAVTATGAIAAVGGTELVMRPVAAIAGSAQAAPASTSTPSATAAALALQLAAGEGSGAPLTPQPTGHPTPSGTDPDGRHGPVVMPCNAAGTNSSSPAVRPCPPPPCAMTSAPSGAMAPDPCRTPPPCEYLAPAGDQAQATPSCAPPPCATANASPSFRDPCAPVPTPSPKPDPTPAPKPCPAADANGQGNGKGVDEGRSSVMWARPCPRWVVLTEKDAGRTITVAPGTWILVRLAGGGVWSEPTSTDQTVVTRTGGSHDRNGGYGSFRAASAGAADLTAMQQPACAPRCKVVTREWTVHVVVSG